MTPTKFLLGQIVVMFAVADSGLWLATEWTDSFEYILTINTKVRLAPNDNRENVNAPAFVIFASSSEVGAAWQQRTNGEYPRDYLSIKLDDRSPMGTP